MKNLVTLVFVSLAAAAIARPVEGGAMVCGGVGSDERETLASHASGANLALEFYAGRGAYVADVDIRLIPARASVPSVSAVADGPICYVQVPAGQYRIEATFNGETRSARATVPEAPPTPVRVAVGFPDPGAPGEHEPAPSPQERQQARNP